MLFRSLEEGGRRTLPGRVHEDDIGLLARVGGFPYPCGGVSGKEAGVFYAVVLCVADGVPDGVPVHFHAHHLPGLVRGRQADGADAAVGVEDDFFAGEVGGIDGQPVENRRSDTKGTLPQPGGRSGTTGYRRS